MDDDGKDLLKGHRDRLRTKYLNAGLDSLLDYERLELLLTYAISRRDVKPVAKALMAKFKTIQGVMDADVPSLCQVEGLAENSALLLKLVKDLCGEYLAEKMERRDVMSDPAVVKNYLKVKFSGMKEEAFVVLYLNTKNHVLSTDIMHEGTVDQAVVYPRNLMKRALELSASGIILVHNHPSGVSKPSADDIELTHSIKDAAKVLNIRLLDHVVVAKDGCFSFIENGIL
jgi:DNA repair protein RadC